MSRDSDLILLLRKAEDTLVKAAAANGATVDQLREVDISGLAASRVLGWLDEALTLLWRTTDEPHPGVAVAVADPSPQSSVEIEQMAKGLPKVRVKVYDAVPTQALARAMDLYATATREYAGAVDAEKREVLACTAASD